MNFRIWLKYYFELIGPQNRLIDYVIDVKGNVYHSGGAMLSKDAALLMLGSGLLDTSGFEIFQYDIVKYRSGKTDYVGEVDFVNAEFVIKTEGKKNIKLSSARDVSIIGESYTSKLK